jgi:uncharacterized protein YndB with AHSA1/START domain
VARNKEKKLTDIVHRVGIKAPIADVYRALSTIDGLAGWWTRETTGTSAPGESINFEFSSPTGEQVGSMTMAVTALVPDQEVRWHCTAGPAEWVGTYLEFKLTEDGDYSIVNFGHKNWREAVEFTGHCSTKWAVFLLSLKAMLETGQGQPAPGDVKIDNWN